MAEGQPVGQLFPKWKQLDPRLSPARPSRRPRAGRSVPRRRAARFTRTRPQLRNLSSFQGFSARLSPARPAALRDNASPGEPNSVPTVLPSVGFTGSLVDDLAGAFAFSPRFRGHLRLASLSRLVLDGETEITMTAGTRSRGPKVRSRTPRERVESRDLCFTGRGSLFDSNSVRMEE